MDQALNSQKTPHTSPLRASYGMSFVSILMKNDRVIKGFYCSYSSYLSLLLRHWFYYGHNMFVDMSNHSVQEAAGLGVEMGHPFSSHHQHLILCQQHWARRTVSTKFRPICAQNSLRFVAVCRGVNVQGHVIRIYGLPQSGPQWCHQRSACH